MSLDIYPEMEIVKNSEWYNNWKCSKCGMIAETLLIIKLTNFCEQCITDLIYEEL
jgi:hypothetical protein